MKATEYLKNRGKEVKPLKDKKDLSNLNAKQRNELLNKMLKDFGYVI